jgi:hypothetical protein
MRSFLFALALAGVLSGCASSYRQQVVTPAASSLERGQAVLIATPKNGAYERREYAGSGLQTAAAVRAAFARHTDRVTVSRCTDMNCLRSEAAGRYTYLVVPEILHWEDRNTEWSGLPDRIEIKLIVADTRVDREVASTILGGKSKWMTFGGDHPQDLLPEPVQRYVDSLY